MMEIRQIQPGDYEFVKANPFQECVKDYPDDLAIPADSWTCIYDGEIVAIGGIKLLFEGVGEAWVMFTKQSRKDGIFGVIAIRAIRRRIEELFVELKLRRCEAQCRADFPKGLRFIETLGFKNPYVREKYNLDGTDMILFSQVFGD